MVKETEDRRINTDEKMHNDGVKRLPHERDESPEGHEKAPHGIMKQAARQVDTDLHGVRGVEETMPSDVPSGQADPQPDAAHSMRDRKGSADVTRKGA
jgi:hypothetical protein